jgi:hypothetical protein
MQVSSPFKFNEYVQPIELATNGFIPTPLEIAIGWGRLSEGGTQSNVLMKVTLPYVTEEDCKEIYGNRFKEETMTCSGQEGKDACEYFSKIT